MSEQNEFTNVTVRKKANIYYDGKVTSRLVTFPDGSTKTLGIMLPGDYEFGTKEKEIMEILAGKLSVKLPGSDEWVHINENGIFEVEANSSFSLQIETPTDYCCSYIAE